MSACYRARSGILHAAALTKRRALRTFFGPCADDTPVSSPGTRVGEALHTAPALLHVLGLWRNKDHHHAVSRHARIASPAACRDSPVHSVEVGRDGWSSFLCDDWAGETRESDPSSQRSSEAAEPYARASRTALRHAIPPRGARRPDAERAVASCPRVTNVHTTRCSASHPPPPPRLRESPLTIDKTTRPHHQQGRGLNNLAPRQQPTLEIPSLSQPRACTQRRESGTGPPPNENQKKIAYKNSIDLFFSMGRRIFIALLLPRGPLSRLQPASFEYFSDARHRNPPGSRSGAVGASVARRAAAYVPGRDDDDDVRLTAAPRPPRPGRARQACKSLRDARHRIQDPRERLAPTRHLAQSQISDLQISFPTLGEAWQRRWLMHSVGIL